MPTPFTTIAGREVGPSVGDLLDAVMACRTERDAQDLWDAYKVAEPAGEDVTPEWVAAANISHVLGMVGKSDHARWVGRLFEWVIPAEARRARYRAEAS